jgi:hypothetical protein
MDLILREVQGHQFLEGTPGQPLLGRLEDLSSVIGACFEHAVHALLLYPENMTEHFFDLSSGQAGEVLQKLRNYQIRLAIIRTPGLYMSSRFGELVADESRGPHFGLFDERAAAQEWLCHE